MSLVLREMRRHLREAKAQSAQFLQPTLTRTPPSGPAWIHEIKHDGFRMMVRRDGDQVRLITRNGYDWTARYPSIAAAALTLRCTSCIIDGEVVICDERGLAVFDHLRTGPQVKPEAFLYAFDLLEVDGEDLRREALEERKASLARALGYVDFSDQPVGRKNRHATPGLIPGIRYVEHIVGDGSEIFAAACGLGCEGIVSKRLGSIYKAGRSRDWLKTKNPDAPWKRRLEEDWGRRK